MEQGLITCPHCGREFELSDVLTGRIREHLRGELLQEVSRREAELKKKTDDLRTLEAQVSKSRAAIDEEIETRLKKRLAEAENRATQKLAGQYTAQLKDLQEALAEKDAAIKMFREQELALRKKQRQLETDRESFELEAARKLDTEREKIRREALQKVGEEHRLKDLEKDKVINDLRASLEDMKRRAEQGSMETQGEVLEQEFEAQLRAFFVHDDIQPVPKGIRGADLVQTVRTPMGAESGVLLWETKNTKAWSAAWIPKLKDDMIEVRASLAILVSVVLPEDIRRFGQLDGIWVSCAPFRWPPPCANSCWPWAASAPHPSAKAKRWKRFTSTWPASSSSRKSRGLSKPSPPCRISSTGSAEPWSATGSSAKRRSNASSKIPWACTATCRALSAVRFRPSLPWNWMRRVRGNCRTNRTVHF